MNSSKMIFRYITLDLVSFILIHPSTTIMLLSYSNESNGWIAATCFCRPFELHMSVFASGCVFLQNIYRHTSFNDANEERRVIFDLNDIGKWRRKTQLKWRQIFARIMNACQVRDALCRGKILLFKLFNINIKEHY